MVALDGRCLVLNQNYEPISITRIRRALCLLYLGKAEAIEVYPHKCHTVSSAYNAPSILRLLHFIHTRKQELPLTKHNILKRDNFTCQYCGKKGPSMTTDHIIPKKANGGDSWENLVCACTECNNNKGNKTPEEAGLKLTRQPKKPHFFFVLNSLDSIPDEKWKQYLFIK